eukprot:GGOE01009966.1.p5 GENE.GGOE01009966.1~~GGOE01009966.1.p5  ORF type:complete len:134 (+),score=8.99 GGOE01009966.1:838-1239(+)
MARDGAQLSSVSGVTHLWHTPESSTLCAACHHAISPQSFLSLSTAVPARLSACCILCHLLPFHPPTSHIPSPFALLYAGDLWSFWKAERLDTRFNQIRHLWLTSGPRADAASSVPAAGPQQPTQRPTAVTHTM